MLEVRSIVLLFPNEPYIWIMKYSKLMFLKVRNDLIDLKRGGEFSTCKVANAVNYCSLRRWIVN